MPFARQKAPRAYRKKQHPVMTLLPEAQCGMNGCDRPGTSYLGYCDSHQRMSRKNPRVQKNCYLKKRYGITIRQLRKAS